MFQGWGFLLSEIWVLIVLAALIGLFVGWLLWGRRAMFVADSAETDRLRAELLANQVKARNCAARVKQLEAALSSARADPPAASAPQGAAAEMPPAPTLAQTAALRVESTAPAAATEPEHPEPEQAEARPQALPAPRDGRADDLKKIKGIGPKLEALCNRLGFWHFDQIAAWTPEEIAWVDANLESFKGRVTRDNWVAQAQNLAAGKRL